MSNFSWRDRIVRAAFLIMLAHLLVKFISLAQNRYLGHYFDAAERDVFTAIFKYMFLTIFLIGEETLGPVFLPAFMRFKERDGKASAWRFASAIFNGYFLILLAITALLSLRPELAISKLTQWTPASHATEIDLAMHLIPWMAPGLIGMGLGSLTYLLLNARERFFWAAAGDVVVKIGILAGIVTAGVLISKCDLPAASGLHLVILGIAAGGTLKVLTHIVALGKEARNWRPTLSCDSTQIKHFFLLVLPLLIGILFAKVRDIYNHLWILSDYKSLITANAFGKTIADSIHYLVPYAVAIALLPFFCMLADDKDEAKFAEILRNSLRAMLFVFVPLSLALVVVSFPLARGFYETGKFTGGDVRLTAVANSCYVLGLSFAAAEGVLMQAFFSKRSVWTPTLIGMLCSSLSIAISFLGIRVLQVSEQYVVPVVAGGFVASRFAKILLLGCLLNRKLPFLSWRTTLAGLRSIAAVGITALLVAFATATAAELLLSKVSIAARIFGALPTMPAYLGLSAMVCALAGLAVLAVSCFLRLEELTWLYTWAIEKYPALDHPLLRRLFPGP